MNHDNILRWAIFSVSVVLFGFGLRLSFTENQTGSAATYTVAIICLIFVFLSKFKRFKGLGLEAEMWEDKMEEANVLIEKLQALAIATAQPILKIVTRIGYWDSSFSSSELEEVKNEYSKIFREMGVSLDRIPDLGKTMDDSIEKMKQHEQEQANKKKGQASP
ncbi:MAG: hypothetical protein HZA02_00705 [Nitrospinae bacterium]|nr:hypothetical protein [Nitrospinota bacterium]